MAKNGIHPSVSSQNSNIYYDPTTWDTALHKASKHGHMEILNALISSGFPVNVQNLAGQSPLHLAITARQFNVARCLIDSGADAMLGDDDGESPLDIAIRQCDGPMINLFLRCNAPPSKCTRYQRSALFGGNEVAIEAFMENRAWLEALGPGNEAVVLCTLVLFPDKVNVLRRFIEHIRKDFGVNCVGDNKVTALHVAAQRNSNPEIVKLLLDAGANPNARDSRIDGTPLLGAALGGHVENARLLLDAGADLWQKFPPGRTLLHVAAQGGFGELIKLFIEKGLDPNALDEKGSTAASWAAQNGHVEALKLMLELGMDIDKPSIDGRTPLVAAALCGHINAVTFLLDNDANINAYDAECDATVLHAAFHNGHEEIVELLIRRGAKVTHKDLVIPKTGPNIRLFDMFCKNGAAARYLENPDSPALAYLLSIHQFEIVAAIVNAGADISKLSDDDRAPLVHICARYVLNFAIEALIAKTTQRGGMLPQIAFLALHIATESGYLEVVRLLRARGWNMLAEDEEGNTAMHVASKHGHSHIVEDLLGEIDIHLGNRDGDTPLHLAAGDGTADIVSMLVRAGAILNKTNNKGQIPLHLACQNDRIAASKLLRDGSDLSRTDLAGLSPLHYAARGGYVGVLGVLLCGDVNVDIVSTNGSTPLHLAVENGTISAIQLLMDAGANPNKKTNLGDVPVALAVYSGDVAVTELLIKHSKIDWYAQRQHNILFRALQSRKADTFALLIRRLVADRGRDCKDLLHRLLPEALAELASEIESAGPVLSLMMPHLPVKELACSDMLLKLLVTCIKYSDDVGLVTAILEGASHIARRKLIDGWTPLHYACKYFRPLIVKSLLQHDADPDVKLIQSNLTPSDLLPTDVSRNDILNLIKRYKTLITAVEQPEHKIVWGYLTIIKLV
jgi:ankyrin repeat protein